MGQDLKYILWLHTLHKRDTFWLQLYRMRIKSPSGFEITDIEGHRDEMEQEHC